MILIYLEVCESMTRNWQQPMKLLTVKGICIALRAVRWKEFHNEEESQLDDGGDHV